MNALVLTQAKKLAANLDIEGDAKELIDTLKATAFKVKDGVVTDAQMTALMIVAQQYGLNPWTRQIFAFPDKQNGIVPVVSVDGWLGIVNSHPQFDGIEFVYSEELTHPDGGKECPVWCECKIYRKDRTRPIIVREYLDEVYRPAFQAKGSNGQPYTVNGPWQSHTKRFLRHKSLIQCARIAFGFGGIFDQDEAENFVEEKIINPRPDEKSDFDKALGSVKTMALEQVRTMDTSMFTNDQRQTLQVARKERTRELREASVVATQEKQQEQQNDEQNMTHIDFE